MADPTDESNGGVLRLAAARLRFYATNIAARADTTHLCAWLHRLSLLGIHQCDCVFAVRYFSSNRSRKAADDAPSTHFADHYRARRIARRRYFGVTGVADLVRVI